MGKRLFAVLPIVLMCVGFPSLFAQTPSLRDVKTHCSQLESYLKSSTGLEQALILHALDECKIDIARLTPPKRSKMSIFTDNLSSILAIGQETYAAQRNMKVLMDRKRQKNAGQVEFNFSSEIVIGGYMSERMIAALYSVWRRNKTKNNGLDDAITGAVLFPH